MKNIYTNLLQKMKLKIITHSYVQQMAQYQQAISYLSANLQAMASFHKTLKRKQFH